MIHLGNCREILPTVADESVQCCITTPPYWALREYGLGDDAIGCDPTPDDYVARLVDVFRDVARVLRPNGTLQLTLGDSRRSTRMVNPFARQTTGLAAGEILGIPWRVAFALRLVGWRLRAEYFWDCRGGPIDHLFVFAQNADPLFSPAGKRVPPDLLGQIWHQKNPGLVEATFEPTPWRFAAAQVQLASNPGDVVLDPFMGIGTVGIEAENAGRQFIGIEMDPRQFAVAARHLDHP